MLRLRIENSGGLAATQAVEFTVDRKGFEIGRSKDADWQLADGLRMVSGRHAEIRYSDNCYWLLDYSANGTFANGSVECVENPFKLMHGDFLRIGAFVISVAISENAAAGFSLDDNIAALRVAGRNMNLDGPDMDNPYTQIRRVTPGR